MEDNNIQDSCCNSKYASIRQMDKLDEMLGRRFPFYPRTVIQAVHDGRTGASLEAILAQYNNIYVQYQGTAGRTRNIVPKEMRRKGIIISYVDMQGNAITEKCVNDAQRDNFHWGLDVNWVRVDELTLSGDISVSVKGTWVINGEDTGLAALGPKGDNGLTPWLKTIDNKLHFSYDNETWEVCSDYIAAYFRFQDNKFQISRDNKTWSDLSGEVTNSLSIKAYVTDKSQYPNPKQGDMIMVGPTYEDDDTEHTKPIYHLNIYNAGGWVNNGPFQSINAGVVQELGDSETEVMSQKAVSEKFSELEETLSKYLLFNNVDVAKAVQEIYIPEEIFHKYPDGVYLWNIGKLRDGNITVQIYGLKSDGSNEKIVDGYYDDFGNVEKYTDNGAFIIDMTNLDQTAGAYQNIKIPIKEAATIIENSPRISYKLGLSKSNISDKSLVADVALYNNRYILTPNIEVAKAVQEIYIPEEIYNKYPYGVYLWNIGKKGGTEDTVRVQVYGMLTETQNERIIESVFSTFEKVQIVSDNGSCIIDLSQLDQTAGIYDNIKVPVNKDVTIIENSPVLSYIIGKSRSNISDTSERCNYYLSTDNYDVIKAVKELYVKKEIYDKYEQVVLYNIGKLKNGNITVQIYGLKSDGGQEEIKKFYTESFGEVEYISNDCSFIIDLSNLDQTAEAYQNIKIPLKKNVTIKEYSPIIYQKLSNNQWYGKKIIWLGTSVPYGQYATKSYALEAANRLGFNLINTSMPGQRIHGYYDEEHDVIMGGQGTIEEPTNAYATTLSKAEYIAAKEAGVSTAEIASSSSPWEPNKGGSSYTRTWENIFVEENADADLWVFDVAPNNTNFETTDWDLFDKENWRYTDDSDFSEHRLTFLGALLFLMNKMYELNPKARLVFVLGTTYAYNEGKSNLELVRNAWNVHIIDLWGKINTSLPSIKYLYSEYTGVDGGKKINRHPSTFGHEKMGQMLANELLLIS